MPNLGQSKIKINYIPIYNWLIRNHKCILIYIKSLNKLEIRQEIGYLYSFKILPYKKLVIQRKRVISQLRKLADNTIIKWSKLISLMKQTKITCHLTGCNKNNTFTKQYVILNWIFCYKVYYWDKWQNLNRLWRLDGNNWPMLIAWFWDCAVVIQEKNLY